GACWLLVMAVLEGGVLGITLWGAIALIAKPTAIVAVLLAGAIRPRSIPTLLLAVIIVIALPYAFAPPHYVTKLNLNFFGLMDLMSLGTSQHFRPADFTAPFNAFGFFIQPAIATAIRMAAALLTLVAVLWFARHREQEKATGLAIYVVASYYMCVFN